VLGSFVTHLEKSSCQDVEAFGCGFDYCLSGARRFVFNCQTSSNLIFGDGIDATYVLPQDWRSNAIIAPLRVTTQFVVTNSTLVLRFAVYRAYALSK
jgi:hypothetical protein